MRNLKGEFYDLRFLGLEFQGDHFATHDLVPDREGRSFSSRGYGRSAIDARSDPHGDLKRSAPRLMMFATSSNATTPLSSQGE